METYLQHGEWEVYKTLVRYENVEYKYYQDEQFPEVFFSIFIRRKYTFYFMYILLPCIVRYQIFYTLFLLLFFLTTKLLIIWYKKTISRFSDALFCLVNDLFITSWFWRESQSRCFDTSCFLSKLNIYSILYTVYYIYTHYYCVSYTV